MKSTAQILAFGIAMMATAVPAAASYKIATYSGTLGSGIDRTGEFGTVGQDLAGISYVVTYTYDRLIGSHQYIDVPTGLQSSYGGHYFGDTSPIVDSSITINGITKHISGAYYGDVRREIELESTTVIGHGAQYTRTITDYHQNFMGIYTRTPVESVSEISFEENVAPVTRTVGGYMSFSHWSLTSSDIYMSVFADFSGPVVYSVGDTEVGAVNRALTGEVPEPASWAMLIAGFGLTGASLRRRRALQTA